MIDKICMFLTNKMRQEMPDIDDEKAEIINYGLQNIIGEIPKLFIMIAVSYFLGIWQLTLITMLIIMPYRCVSGGVHLKTHLGCIISTCLMYCGVAYISKYIVMTSIIKYIVTFIIWVFSMIMIHYYAPADTENVPILRKKERKYKKIASYCIFTIAMIIALIIPNETISNIIIFGYFVQTCMITRLVYKLSGNQYGYEVYQNI